MEIINLPDKERKEMVIKIFTELRRIMNEQSENFSKETKYRASLVAQWLKSPPTNAGDTGSSPGPGRSHMLRSN